MKKIVTCVVGILFLINSVICAVAQNNGTIVGQGELEGHVDKDVLAVVFPTVVTGYSPFEFILDPQKLISGTAAGAYGNVSVDADATVLFKNRSVVARDGSYANESVKRLGGKSDALAIYNKSSVSVNITYTPVIKGYDDIRIVEAEDEFVPGVPGMYLTLESKIGNEITTCSILDRPTISEVRLPKLDGAYEVKYVSASITPDRYVYELKDDLKQKDLSAFPSCELSLYGGCNSDADWSEYTNVAPMVDVVWSYESNGDYYDNTEFTEGTAVGELSFAGLGEGRIIKAIMSDDVRAYDVTRAFPPFWDSAVIDYDNATMVIDEKCMEYMAIHNKDGGKLIIHYENADTGREFQYVMYVKLK